MIDWDRTIVNPGGNTPPGLNRGEKGEKPDNRMTGSNIAGTTTYTYGTLGYLMLEKSKNDVVDYEYDELNQ